MDHLRTTLNNYMIQYFLCRKSKSQIQYLVKTNSNRPGEFCGPRGPEK